MCVLYIRRRIAELVCMLVENGILSWVGTLLKAHICQSGMHGLLLRIPIHKYMTLYRYQNDDGVPSFDGYFPFGGWIDPSVKQINLEFKVCATPINENWRLEWSDF